LKDWKVHYIEEPLFLRLLTAIVTPYHNGSIDFDKMGSTSLPVRGRHLRPGGLGTTESANQTLQSRAAYRLLREEERRRMRLLTASAAMTPTPPLSWPGRKELRRDACCGPPLLQHDLAARLVQHISYVADQWLP
jgi:hypothetical protein